MHAWFARTGSLLLTISSHGILSDAPRNMMHHHANRIQICELDVPPDVEIQYVAYQPFPALSKLYIGADDDDDSGFPDADSCVPMLCAAPALLECKFSTIHYNYIPESISPSTHASLKHLQLGSYPGDSDTKTADILLYLTLPALGSLSIREFDIRHEDFMTFFTRSSPPLQTLRISLFRTAWSTAQIESLWQVVPNLTELDLFFKTSATPDSSYPSRFIQVLAEYSPRKLLPNLHTLVMRGVSNLENSHYVQLMDLLVNRQPQLRTFRLLVNKYKDFASPDAGIIVSMRELVAYGMEIHVGIIGKSNNNLI
ncbi:hypothetical protein C8R43DRAFT_1233337 [Mycena crocata]|nr:hypothetical protein C8R43DRAFT_1233337 [Mycena crocata]